jgi:hypothetical protein
MTNKTGFVSVVRPPNDRNIPCKPFSLSWNATLLSFLSDSDIPRYLIGSEIFVHRSKFSMTWIRHYGTMIGTNALLSLFIHRPEMRP